MNNWILTLTHKQSGQQRQFLLESEGGALAALEAIKAGSPFTHNTGVTSLKWDDYCELTISPAQASFDQLQWFTYQNMLAQTRGQHEVQALIAGEYAKKKAMEDQEAKSSQSS